MHKIAGETKMDVDDGTQNTSNFLLGRASIKYISPTVFRKPRIVQGRWFPTQHHVAAIYSHLISPTNLQNITVLPLLDMNILNKLYSPRYMQEISASYNGTSWAIGPSYHWLIQQNTATGKDTLGNGLFNVGTNTGLSMATSSVDYSGTQAIDRIYGSGATNQRTLIYTRGVYLKGQVSPIITIRNNGIRPTYLDLYELTAKQNRALAGFTSSAPWWSQMLTLFNDSIWTTYSENDWTPYNAANTSLADTVRPQDIDLSISATGLYTKTEFNPRDLSTDTTIAQHFSFYNHRHVALSPGQQVTLRLKPIKWFIDLKKLHTQLYFAGLFPSVQADMLNYLTNMIVKDLNRGLMLRFKGGIAHDATDPQKVGVDDSEIDIKMDNKYSWTFKCDDALVLPTKGSVKGALTNPVIVLPNNVQES